MKRTQIYFDEQTYDYLKKESKSSHITISGLIRESIRERMDKKTGKILESADSICGLWKDRTFDVEKRIRELRKDRKLCTPYGQ